MTSRLTRSGWWAASSIAVWPPIDWPTTGTDAAPRSSSTATTSATYAARETSSGRRVLLPWPRCSTEITR